MNPDLPTTQMPTFDRDKNGGWAVTFGAQRLHYPNADDAMTVHAYIVQEIGRREKAAKDKAAGK